MCGSARKGQVCICQRIESSEWPLSSCLFDWELESVLEKSGRENYGVFLGCFLFFFLPLLCENKKGPKSISLFLFLVCYFSGIVCVGCFMSMDIIFRLWESHKMQHSMLNKTYVSITWGKNNLFAWKLLNCIFSRPCIGHASIIRIGQWQMRLNKIVLRQWSPSIFITLYYYYY